MRPIMPDSDSFWALRVNAIRHIGGGESWISRDDWQAAEADPLAPFAAGVMAHMNADHADAMVLYCRAFSKATDISAATMTGVDRYGFDMSVKTPDGPRPVRLAFAQPVTTPEEVRAALVAMVKDARSSWKTGRAIETASRCPCLRNRNARHRTSRPSTVDFTARLGQCRLPQTSSTPGP